MSYVVVCRSDYPEGFEYVLATRRLFRTIKAAAEYANGLADSRYPRVLNIDEYLVSYENWR
jgi:hypothetical protein